MRTGKEINNPQGTSCITQTELQVKQVKGIERSFPFYETI